MAEIAKTEVSTPFAGNGVTVIKWSNLGNGDTGEPIILPSHADKTVQVVGTFGAGGNARMQGANDPSSPIYAGLADPQGNALDVTGAKIEQILENPYQVRPNITAGDGTTDLTIILVLRAAR